MSLHIQIITPEKVIEDTEAQEVIIPTVEGQITVLPHHVPLVAQIAPGELTIRQNGKDTHFVVDGGFAEITGKEVNILADYALHGKDVSVAKAEEAKKKAEKRMAEEKLSEKDFAIAEAEFRRAILELKAAGRKGKV